MKVILTEEQFNRVILNEGVVEVLQDIYDGIRDKGYNIFYVVKLLGKLGYSIPKWTFKKEHKRLEGESDDEWSARIKKLMKDEVDRWLSIQEKNHPQYRVRRAISRVKKQLEELGDITYDKLATHPDNFSDFQKELLLKNLEVTDTGVGRKITEGWYDEEDTYYSGDYPDKGDEGLGGKIMLVRELQDEIDELMSVIPYTQTKDEAYDIQEDILELEDRING